MDSVRRRAIRQSGVALSLAPAVQKATSYGLPRLKHCILAATVALLPFPAAIAEDNSPAWKLDGEPIQWQVEGVVEEDEDISALVITGDGLGALASDETRSFQHFTFCRDSKVIKMVAPQTLLPGKGTEVDIEAAALSPCGLHAYFVGSHSMARKKGVLQPTRSNVFRVGVTQRGGFSNRTERADFRTAIASQPELAAALDQPADGTGIDIEGLAAHGENLLIGFRAPLIEGKAAVLEVPEHNVFGRRPLGPASTLHLLDLGDGRGIRDMLRVPDGFLLIGGDAGNDPDSPTFDLFFWPGPGQPASIIGPITNPPGKAEALGLLEADPDTLEILLMFDGPANGAPRSQRLRRELPPPPLSSWSHPHHPATALHSAKRRHGARVSSSLLHRPPERTSLLSPALGMYVLTPVLVGSHYPPMHDATNIGACPYFWVDFLAAAGRRGVMGRLHG